MQPKLEGRVERPDHVLAGRRAFRVRVGAVVALAAAAGVGAWALTHWHALTASDGGSSSPAASHAATASAYPRVGPVGESAASLRKLAGSFDEPIYWLGPVPGYTYELTRTTTGKVYVRYLPTGVDVGDRRARYLIVATYPYRNAFSALKAVAAGDGLAVRGGGLAVPDPTYPKSVHLAFRNVAGFQIEVYDPSPARARRLALSGRVGPVR
jgi:hypothetical protein